MPLGIDATIRYYDEQLDAPDPQSELDTRRAVQHAPATAGCRRRRSATPGSRRSRPPPTPRSTKYLFYVRKPGKSRRARVLHHRRAVRARRRSATRPRARPMIRLGRVRLAGRALALAADAQRGARGRSASTTGATCGCRCRRELFAETVRALPAAGFRGVNVTIPHKEAALALADEATETARAIGAANTLTFEDGGDPRRQHRRARASWARCQPLRPTDAPRSCSAPAAPARAVRLGAAQAGAAEVRGLEPDARARRGARRELGARAVGAPQPADIVVNCTSVGLSDPEATFKALPLRADELGAGSLVVDMVYRHGGTHLLEAARTRRSGGGRRTGDPGRPGRSVVRTLDRPDGSPPGDAGGRQQTSPHMNPPTTEAATRPRKAATASPRRHGAAAPAAC